MYLNKARKNLAANLDRSPLIHSYRYASAGNRSTLLAIFPLSFFPFMQYTGKSLLEALYPVNCYELMFPDRKH